ncbi:MAG: lysoplasmalogenase family protein [Sandaracinobacter sp.]
MRALPLFLAALVAGTSYMISWALPIPDWAAIAWKGMGVGLLAAWASRQGSSLDHRLLAIVLTLGATADMVLELNFVAGAAIFALGHVVTIVLYYRNRMPNAPLWQRLLAVVVVPLLWGPIVHAVPADWQMPVAVYSLFLTGMFLMAVYSRFPLAAVGAALFALSDSLIFRRMGPLEGAGWADFAIWTTYFAGQALIAWGVAGGLRESRA